MNLSAEVASRLLAAQQNESNYCPNAEIAAHLSEKTLVMVVGPVAVGKNFVMKKVCAKDPSFTCVSVFTTRDGRADDEPGLFRLYPHTDKGISELLDLIDKGEVVQYMVHPTTGRMYGTTLEDYHSQVNLLPTLSNVVDSLKKLPFKKTVTVGLASTAKAWTERLDIRYQDHNDPERLKRLKEAVTSLEWLTTSDDIHWINDSTPGAEDAAQEIINVVMSGSLGNPETKNYAHDMLAQVKLWTTDTPSEERLSSE